MTGFGTGEAAIEGGRIRFEVRTVNHRFFSANVRLARAIEEHEALVRETLRVRLRRGHANVSVRIEPDSDEDAVSVEVNLPRARALARALTELKAELGLEGAVDLALLARLGDVVSVGRDDAPAVPADAMMAALLAAADAVTAMRESEGAALAVDLLERADAISKALAEVEARAPERLRAEGRRLLERVQELAGAVDVDPDRLAQEVAYIADRWDVGEEVVRLRAHVERLRETVRSPPDEPVGKRLAFLVQEMHREVNTIGSKANDTDISHRVIEMKNEVERLREQVENVE
ncbi:MAG TPA: YicC/YloC family endoribonuclease [Longimicrobiales bacterium]|nr:YicC/YloC family endoribonuclease [Longimicrobiales bacterium]